MNETQFFAHIDDENIVIEVHVVTREFINENPERYAGTWVETFIDAQNKTYAGIGFTYDPKKNDFIAPPIQLEI